MARLYTTDENGNATALLGTPQYATDLPLNSSVGAPNTAQAISDLIKYADVSVGNVSIGSNGYADISANANIPATPTGYKVLFAVMTNFGSSTSKNAGITVFCPHQGEYWVGSVANDSITNLEIRIFYIRNA